MTFTDKDYSMMSEYIHRHFGILLGDEKRALLSSRLQTIFMKRGIVNLGDYYSLLLSDSDGTIASELVNAIATNHTFFWREYDHFELLSKRIFPELAQQLSTKGESDIRVWCSACSSGEEAYTLVMLMKEFFGLGYGRLNAGVLATDISEKALDAARAGIYHEERLRLLPQNFRSKYFTRLSDGLWQISDEIKKEVTFRRHNLMNKTFLFKKNFDIIFCRNAMIYFDEKTRWELTQRFHSVLSPGGYFFVGHSETLGREQKIFQYIQPAAYRKKI